MVDSGVIELDVFYDYLCPFVYRASVLLQNVGRVNSRLKVTWRYFSLAQVNSKDDGWTAWEAPASETVKGRLAFMAAEAARRQGRFDDLHMPLLHARHRDRQDLDDVAVVERIAAEAGLDLEQLGKDLVDPEILAALARDHTRGVTEHGVFGTPTLLFAGGASAYLRLSRILDGEEAGRAFARVMAIVAEEPSILEIKRPSHLA